MPTAYDILDEINLGKVDIILQLQSCFAAVSKIIS
jgi:hypothetical protein